MEERKDKQEVKTLVFKIAGMRRPLLLFWHGLVGIVAGVGAWVLVFLGLRDDSRYGRFMRRTVATCFALMMVMMASALIIAFCETVPRLFGYRWGSEDYTWYNKQTVSHGVTFYSTGYDARGVLLDSDGKKLLTGMQWIAMPEAGDSLVCYSDGRKRGYFNMNDGRLVVEPRYNHAWIFSEGLAAVDDGGWIKFIDTAGRTVIDTRVPFCAGSDGYAFHGGHCAVRDSRSGLSGLIDRQGRWVLEMEYTGIERGGAFWIVERGDEQSVLTDGLQTVVPFMAGELCVREGHIDATMADHTMRRYSLDGELLEDFLVNSVDLMTYETAELRYGSTIVCDEEGNAVGTEPDDLPTHVRATAACLRYEAESGWYGLMSADGKAVTLPSYCSIEAVGRDMYLCKYDYDNGVFLDGRGQRVE